MNVKPDQRIEAISVEDALEIVLRAVRPLPVVDLAAIDSAGFVLAQNLHAPSDLPRFRNSAMDGFALRSAETSGASGLFDVAGTISAGGNHWRAPLDPMTAIRVMTGAQIPDEADAVVRFEEVEEVGERIRISRAIAPGEHVRAVGSDIASGAVALVEGSILSWPSTALLTALGVSSVLVHRRPVVAVISTGDELGRQRPQSIHDSNGPMLMELIRSGGGQPEFAGVAGDSRDALEAVLRGALTADAIVISGGVSAGDRDVVRDLLADREAALVSQVRMKPGRPFTFAVFDGKPFFALPGNPIAAAATFLQFVRPALDRMRGKQTAGDDGEFAIAASRIENPGKRRLVVPVRLHPNQGGLPYAERVEDGTAGLALLARAGGLLVIPESTAIVNQGEAVQLWRLPA